MNNRLFSKLSEYRFHNHSWVKRVLEYVEFLLVVCSIGFSYFIVVHTFKPPVIFNPIEFFLFSIFLLISWFVVSRITAMAKIPRTQRYRTIIFQFIQSNFIILLLLFLVKLVFNLKSIPVHFIFIYVFLSLLSTMLFRLTAFHFLKIYRTNGYNLHHVLIIADAFSDTIIEKLILQKEWGFKIRGIVTRSKLIRVKYGNDIKMYNDTTDIKEILDNNVIDEVMYCKCDVDEFMIKQIVSICNEVGVIFRLQSSVSPLEPQDIQLKTLTSHGFLSLVDIPSCRISLVLKHMSDIYFSFLALIILSPLYLLIAILIKLDSKGPVFFMQERIGLRGRKFKLIKFRTMSPNAELVLERLMEQNEMDGPVFKIKDDPRITRLGRFLRKTCLDEIPQFYNVLTGEMSLIGPRPPLESEVKKYQRWQLRRLSVKPGITCTWQVIPNRNDIKFEKWMRMDLKYIDNWSLTKDISLMFKTIATVFTASGW